MALSFEFYWSYRSPYSYLALPRVVALTREFDVDVNLRIVQPAAVRNPGYFKTMNPIARPYFLLDGVREAAFLGLPFRRPVPDPIVQDQTTLAIAAHQPYIFRLSRLGVAACGRGRGLSFADEVSRVLWDGTVDNWHEGDHLARAAERAGLDLAEMDRAIAAEPDRYDAASRPTTRRCGRRATGACRRRCSAANRFSGRTGWIRWCGGCGSTGWQHGRGHSASFIPAWLCSKPRPR